MTTSTSLKPSTHVNVNLGVDFKGKHKDNWAQRIAYHIYLHLLCLCEIR